MRSRRATRPVDYQALAGNKDGTWSDAEEDRPARVRSPMSVDMVLHRALPPIKAKPAPCTNQPPRPMSAHAMYAGPYRHGSPPPGGGQRPGPSRLQGFATHGQVPVSPVSAKHSEAAATLVDLFYSLPVGAVEAGRGRSQPPPSVHLDLDAAWYTPHGRVAAANEDAAGGGGAKAARVKRPREEDDHSAQPPPRPPPGEPPTPTAQLQWLVDRLVERQEAVAAADTLPAELVCRYQAGLAKLQHAASDLLHRAALLQDGGSAVPSPSAGMQGGALAASPTQCPPNDTPQDRATLRDFITQHASQLQGALADAPPPGAAGPCSVQGGPSTPEGPPQTAPPPPWHSLHDRADYQVHVPLSQVALADKEQRLVAQIASTWQQPGAGEGPGAPGWVLLARLAREVTRRFAAGMVLDAPDAQQLRSFFATLYFAAQAAPCLRETVSVVLSAYEQAGLDAALQELLKTVHAAVGASAGGDSVTHDDDVHR